MSKVWIYYPPNNGNGWFEAKRDPEGDYIFTGRWIKLGTKTIKTGHPDKGEYRSPNGGDYMKKVSASDKAKKEGDYMTEHPFKKTQQGKRKRTPKKPKPKPKTPKKPKVIDAQAVLEEFNELLTDLTRIRQGFAEVGGIDVNADRLGRQVTELKEYMNDLKTGFGTNWGVETVRNNLQFIIGVIEDVRGQYDVIGDDVERYSDLIQRYNVAHANRNALSRRIDEAYRTENARFGMTNYSQRLWNVSTSNRRLSLTSFTRQNVELFELGISGLQMEFDALINEIRQAGRRCSNDETFLDMNDTDDLEELPDDMIVRLHGDLCWHIDELIDYLKNTANGQNIGRRQGYLRDYPHETLWRDQVDYEKIVNHPVARAQNLEQWMETRQYANLADRISNETTRTLYETGYQLWSRGEPFQRALREHMNQRQLQRWNDVSAGMTIYELPYQIRAQQTQLDTEIFNIINGVIKSDAITRVYDHIQQLSADERDALRRLAGDDMLRAVEACQRGDHCVM